MPYSLTVKKIDGKPGQVYYPLQLNEVPKPTPGPGQVLVKLAAAALNHRDLFIRQHLYPGISFAHPLLADGYGTVVQLGPGCSAAARATLLDQPVLLVPTRGWDAAPDGPEDQAKRFCIIGASAGCEVGTAQEWAVVDEGDVVRAPEHLTPAEGAALPLVGVTGWRALVSKSGNAEPGRNLLVTGIGGGVALQVLQFAVARGCNVFVTSGDDGKIERAKGMGAAGGVNYKRDGWEKALGGLLPAERPYLDAVIDGAGGDVVGKTVKLLKPGGVIVSYGMTVGPKMDWLMQATLKQVELRGSTMGSKAEFRDMVEFVREHKIRPVVSRVVKGLDNIEAIDGLFEDMKAGRQFGKLVIQIDPEADSSSKL
ncbi:45cabbcd-cb4a-45f4-a292-5506c30a1c57 [Thermothielavioides terrestris]|uniref:45cabbcd-cb4a-45f4-a292-5506c30a1c57 n=1 Tax=Thermothielavioides terrestris TaxID=2587410 RepID=A0A3S4F5H5_9PEZI|nr:45cabbcd-cb4a-45f4-a292-5506c30a1c57 [Thermothielavioides terrestris]